MIGWGRYSVDISFNASQFHFTLNMIDGKWMNGSASDDRFNFRVNLSAAGVVTVDIWNGSSWDALNYDDEVSFWNKFQNPSRERQKILVSNKSFTILPYTPTGGGSVTYPIYANSATIDVDISEAGQINVADEKELIFRDFDLNGTIYQSAVLALDGCHAVCT